MEKIFYSFSQFFQNTHFARVSSRPRLLFRRKTEKSPSRNFGKSSLLSRQTEKTAGK